MANIIEISHLSKRFGSVLAVDDLSFCVREGELMREYALGADYAAKELSKISRKVPNLRKKYFGF
jgi:ABC-type Na+ transport system ATPase subunit NatA